MHKSALEQILPLLSSKTFSEVICSTTDTGPSSFFLENPTKGDVLRDSFRLLD